MRSSNPVVWQRAGLKGLAPFEFAVRGLQVLEVSALS
jgi:hypothetical protein